MDRLLRKLGTHRRVLVIGAHPDDEDTELLALVSQGMGGEAAYLSLSRGEGGQNLVGPDLGVGLGLVRSQELCAARRLDGGRQFFTRAYDFGFTRSLDEAFRYWPRDVLLEDAVRIVRRFRPQVVVSVFSGTPRDGHGQHQAAGVTAQDAYRAAGDAKALPALSGRGPHALAAAGALPLGLLRPERRDDRVAHGRRRSADRPLLLPDRHGQPQPPSLAGHGSAPGARAQRDPRGVDRRRQGQGGRRSLCRRRHAPARARGRGPRRRAAARTWKSASTASRC